ncbi:DNA adenine methylase [Pseudomonas fluorescens]|uniref:DNA adenine methylase n=1 Tax=Pseudomonas fluorescens TaxID=294 RepID=UPI00147407A1|nr:DNA adenine methylase [Pseudomonas fluorescens]NNB66949.1 adenine methyltransferase [Pseudomonas fluorescens]
MFEDNNEIATEHKYTKNSPDKVGQEFFFPTTRYYGSKKRLLSWISSSIAGLEFESVLDVFGGTSTVSLLFKSLEKKVFYNDILLSSSLQARALLSNKSADNIEDVISDFCSGVVPCNGFITENFKDVFYTREENEWLDGAINSLEGKRGTLEYAEIFYCLQQACIQKRPFNLFHRKNLYIRLNNKKDTKFGNWATWERSFTELMLRAAKELRSTRWASRFEPVVLDSADALSLKPGYDLVYLDPPYVPTMRKDISYLERYHFLEGLASPQSWAEKIDWERPSRVFRRIEEVDRWNTKSSFKENLFDLILQHKKSIVVLSYVEGAHPSLSELEEFFNKVFSVCVVHSRSLSHALSSKAKKELLIIGRP